MAHSPTIIRPSHSCTEAPSTCCQSPVYVGHRLRQVAAGCSPSLRHVGGSRSRSYACPRLSSVVGIPTPPVVLPVSTYFIQHCPLLFRYFSCAISLSPCHGLHARRFIVSRNLVQLVVPHCSTLSPEVGTPGAVPSRVVMTTQCHKMPEINPPGHLVTCLAVCTIGLVVSHCHYTVAPLR